MNADCKPNGTFLWVGPAWDKSTRLRAKEQLRNGQVFAQCLAGCDSGGVPIPGGLIHDWVGVVFVPGVSLPQMLSLLQDYDHAQDYYRPDVTRSKLLSRSGNSFQVFLQLKQTDVLTVVFNMENRILYIPVSASRVCSTSHSLRIAEVANAGGAQEHEKSPDSSSGFLWRLDSYWRFEEADGGVYIQCRAISLTRDVPPGLNWVVAPFIKDIPGKSLRFTLGATRAALLRKFPAPR
ncbi:MAG: SRPBCC family protein [Candidatus Acidiferrales bacterium]